MPGSRRQEIAKILPLFLHAAVKLNSEFKKCVFLLPLASTLTDAEIAEHRGRVDRLLDIRIIKNERYAAMAACDAAMAASGTLTMELAILRVPMVVCYRVSMVSYLLAKPFIKAKYASLVNLVAGKAVVPELLQYKATPENIHKEILSLLRNKATAEAMQQELAKVCEQLGEPGASKRAANLAMEMITTGVVSRD
jgi:lipid-A-disaccharide synthase